MFRTHFLSYKPESTSRLYSVRIEKNFKMGSCKDSRFRYYIFLRLGPQDVIVEMGV